MNKIFTKLLWGFVFLNLIILFSGCRTEVERVVKIINTRQHMPAANKPFDFHYSPDLAPLVKVDMPVMLILDTNGEARIRLHKVRGWASILENGTNYGTSLESTDIKKGGKFRLYGPPPTLLDTNLYPSPYLLELKKP